MKIKLIEKYDSYEKGIASYLVFEAEDIINFKPGQFMILDNGTIKRPYSIATSPILMENKKQIGFYVKKVSENGMSNYLVNEINIGDTIDMNGPFGHMILKEAKNYLLISIGSGFAPIFSIIQHLYLTNFSGKIINLYGERYVSNLVEKILVDLNNWVDNIDLINNISLSREDEEKIAKLSKSFDKIDFSKGHVQDKLSETINNLDIQETLVYICGKPAMVDDIVQILINKGFDKSQIFFEKY